MESNKIDASLSLKYIKNSVNKNKILLISTINIFFIFLIIIGWALYKINLDLCISINILGGLSWIVCSILLIFIPDKIWKIMTHLKSDFKDNEFLKNLIIMQY